MPPLNLVSGATNLGAAATASVSLANEAAEAGTGKGFLSDQQEQGLNTATFFLGSIAGATGVAAGAADARRERSRDRSHDDGPAR